MAEKIKKLLIKYAETVRYLIFGVLTVIVNTVLYMCLSLFLDDIPANTAAFILSVLFAYWTNSRFVFRDKMRWGSFVKFFGMRIGTILIDNGGMWLLLAANCDKLMAKCAVNAVIIVLNYIFSKFFIFAGKGKEKRK